MKAEIEGGCGLSKDTWKRGGRKKGSALPCTSLWLLQHLFHKNKRSHLCQRPCLIVILWMYVFSGHSLKRDHYLRDISWINKAPLTNCARKDVACIYYKLCFASKQEKYRCFLMVSLSCVTEIQTFSICQWCIDRKRRKTKQCLNVKELLCNWLNKWIQKDARLKFLQIAEG